MMDRTDHDKKMQRMLSEESTYQLIEKDPTPSLERKMNAQLMSLKRSGRLPSEVYIRTVEKQAGYHYSTGYARYTNRMSHYALLCPL